MNFWTALVCEIGWWTLPHFLSDTQILWPSETSKDHCYLTPIKTETQHSDKEHCPATGPGRSGLESNRTDFRDCAQIRKKLQREVLALGCLCHQDWAPHDHLGGYIRIHYKGKATTGLFPVASHHLFISLGSQGSSFFCPTWLQMADTVTQTLWKTVALNLLWRLHLLEQLSLCLELLGLDLLVCSESCVTSDL